MTPARPTLILADDHPMLVEGLERLLSRRYQVVGKAHSGPELLALLDTTVADCLLLDLSMPGTSGLELLPDARKKRPQMKILVVTQHVDRVIAEAVMEAGADGFVPKDSGSEDLREAITAVLSGEKFVSDRVPKRSYRITLGAPHPGLAGLTPRQLEILRLIARGMSTADIAAELGLSQSTVTFHRVNIRKTLGLDSERGLVRWAILMQVGESEVRGEGREERKEERGTERGP